DTSSSGTNAAMVDQTRAPIAFGRRAVPQLFEVLQLPETDVMHRRRALVSLCDLMHDPQRIHQAVDGGVLEQLEVLLKDEDATVRKQTCELLHLICGHNIGRYYNTAILGCSTRQVMNRLAMLPAGAKALLALVPKLLTKLEEEEEEEVQVLLLSTLSFCSTLDALPALALDAVSLVRQKLLHSSQDVRREAAAAMMALSVPEEGKRRVCKEAVLPEVVRLLQEADVKVQANAVAVIMYTAITTEGKMQCLDLDVVPVLLDLKRRRRKALVMYCLRALTTLAEAPRGRHLLMEQLPLLEKWSEVAEKDEDIRRAAQTAVRVITWAP
uniref:Radial spoke head 14 homolog n=1 Tax=Cynoglossus semilaevis TaxID=244447 RepID=A0A3P8VMS5_CYNSE